MSAHNPTNRQQTQAAVIGGGLVGMGVALGLARQGLKVTVFDEGDVALRASRGNFGLVWVQGKGDTLPEYARWTRESARLWPALAAELRETTGVDVQLSQVGGMYICLSPEELAARAATLEAMREQAGGDYPFEVLDLPALRERVPEIGPTVAGATFCPEDGHVNPLLMMRTLSGMFMELGGQLVNGHAIEDLAPDGAGFRLRAGGTTWHAERVVLAAGLGNRKLAPRVGLEAPVHPQRGQVLVAERVRPFLRYPTGHVRQTGEGSVQCGDSKEDVQFDEGTTTAVMAAIARRAVRMFPLLAGVRLVRAWGALRIMTPDGYPVYQQSEAHPGAYLVSCHSGVTLCAAHAGPLAGWLAGGPLPPHLEVFHAGRFALS